MQDFQTVLVSWIPKTSRNGNSYWELTYQGGQLLSPTKTSTWNAGLAQKAMGLVNVQGITVRLKQDGKYTNTEEIAGPGEQLPPLQAQPGMPIGQPMGGGFPQQQAIGAPVQQQAIGVDPGAATESERQERISRQAAQRTAAILLSGQLESLESLEAFEELHRGLAMRLARDADPSNDQAQAAPIVPTAETPAEVVAEVNAAAGDEVVQQGAPVPSWSS